MISILFNFSAAASFVEDFGASAASLGRAGMANLIYPSASANYYLPASLAYNTDLKLEASSFVNTYEIKPIENIVIENSINTESGEEKIGSVSNNFSNLITNSVHFSLPLKKLDGTLNISISSPFPYAGQFDSGDPYTPEYSLLKARPRRPQAFLNLAYQISPKFSFSLGGHLGAKVDSSIFTKAAVNNEGETTLYTYASGSGEVSPKFSPIFSIFYNGEVVKLGFSYQGEMESSLKVDLTADEISTGIIFDSIIESVLFHDPETLKLQASYELTKNILLHSSINYYNWSKYQTPKINIIQLAIMTGTFNYEKLELRNTFSPKFAFTYILNSYLSLNGGLAYDQSPLESNFVGNGNTIHSDLYTISFSPEFEAKIADTWIKASLGLSYKKLKDRTIVKSSGQENGISGRKIGAPGYNIGGNIKTISLGIELNI
mgnify:CR=1 FL=1